MRETEMIRRIRNFSKGGRGDSRIIKGIGDDCAIVRPRAGEDLVFTTDFAIEDRHFTLATHRPADVGHKALARSLSDLASMGSSPVFCLVSLALPGPLGSRWLSGFYQGLLGLGSRYGIALAGGDLSKNDRVVIDVMCCGTVPRGKAMRRDTARPGDSIYVTGPLGGSANGFASRRGVNWKRHLRPEPRIDTGIALRRRGIICAMDLSDGLSLDLGRLCQESRVGAELHNDLPIAKGATLENALHGGEDYELLFTTSRKMRALPVTCIGVVTAAHPGQIRFDGKRLPPGGFDHFR